MTYIDKILGIEYASLIGYYPLDETGGSDADDKSSQANDGSYTGVDLANAAGPDGPSVPYFDGANDYVDLESSGLQADFDGEDGTMAIWIKADSGSVWEDSAYRSIFVLNETPEGNRVVIEKSNTNNTINAYRYADSTLKQVEITESGTGWIHLAITWNVTADEVKVYVDGSQYGSTLGSIDNWTGISSIDYIIGAFTTTPTEVWHGWLAHAIIWSKALTASQIGDVYTILSPTLADNITIGESVDVAGLVGETLSIDIGLDEAAYQGTGVRILGP